MCSKCTKPLSFDSPAETGIVRRFPTSAKVFVSTSAGTRTRDSLTATAVSSHSATEVRFDGVRRGNYFGGKAIRRTEVEVRVGKLKNGKAAGSQEK